MYLALGTSYKDEINIEHVAVVAYSILQPHIDAQAVRTALNLDVLDGELQQGLAGSGGPKEDAANSY